MLRQAVVNESPKISSPRPGATMDATGESVVGSNLRLCHTFGTPVVTVVASTPVASPPPAIPTRYHGAFAFGRADYVSVDYSQPS